MLDLPPEGRIRLQQPLDGGVGPYGGSDQPHAARGVRALDELGSKQCLAQDTEIELTGLSLADDNIAAAKGEWGTCSMPPARRRRCSLQQTLGSVRRRSSTSTNGPISGRQSARRVPGITCFSTRATSPRSPCTFRPRRGLRSSTRPPIARRVSSAGIGSSTSFLACSAHCMSARRPSRCSSLQHGRHRSEPERLLPSSLLRALHRVSLRGPQPQQSTHHQHLHNGLL